MDILVKLFFVFHYRKDFEVYGYNFERNGLQKSPPPFNLTIMKGTRYVALDRQLAEFVVRDPIAIKLYNWVADMISGDESFFSTLAVISGTNNGSVVQDVNKTTDNGLESGL